MFTKTDKALLNRAARLQTTMANDLYKEFGSISWGQSRESRAAKDVYDRLLRDARDLNTLAGRLIKQAKIPTTQLKIEMPAAAQLDAAELLPQPNHDITQTRAVTV